MLHFWVQSYAKSAVSVQSATISFVAHVALAGAAVYGTQHAVADAEVRRTERAVYYAPPDRQPARAPLVERLRFIDIGSGTQTDEIPTPNGTKRHVADAGLDRLHSPGHGTVTQQAQLEIQSNDSVYSILTVDAEAVRMEGSAAPIYPAELMKNNVEGLVVVKYVVDSTGRAELETFEVLSSTHSLFADAVRVALPGMRFAAAVVDGRTVRQLVNQPFYFRITPPTPAPSEHTRTSAVP